MRVKLDYGRTGLDVEIPERNLVGPLQIRQAEPLALPEQAILDALTKPRILPPLKTTPKALRDLAAMLARYDDSDTATALRWAADDIEALQSS